MSSSRIYNSFLNFASGIVFKLITIITSFVVRTIFIRYLNEEYLGINGLYTNILTVLSLAELGFGSAIVYSMYKPLSEQNYYKVSQLMSLYKKIYRIIGCIVLVVGLSLIPFLNYLIKDQPDIDGLVFYYVLFLLNSVVSYWFFSYRNSILTADQKSYIINKYQGIFNLIKSVLQIIVLITLRSFTFYLLSQIICTIGQNIVVAIYVSKKYSESLEKPKEKLQKDEKKQIFHQVKGLMLTRIGHVILNSTDNIIISAFVGLAWVGLLSNVSLITETVVGVLTLVTSAMQASLGNYFATKSKKEGYDIFKKIEFLNYLLYGFCCIAIITLANPFITIWLGKEYTLPFSAIIFIGINFFIAGYMNTLWTFRSTLGLFTQGRYRALIVAGLNIVLSIGLSYPFGITGVLAATAISQLCVNLWYDPWIIHKYGFNESVKPFFIRYLKRILLLVLLVLGIIFLSKLVFLKGILWWNFILMILIVATLPTLTFVLIYYKTSEFKYFIELIKVKIFKKDNP